MIGLMQGFLQYAGPLVVQTQAISAYIPNDHQENSQLLP